MRTSKNVLSEHDNELRLQRLVVLARLCQISNRSFMYFENNYTVPTHISPIAWSRAAKLDGFRVQIENPCWFKAVITRQKLETGAGTQKGIK